MTPSYDELVERLLERVKLFDLASLNFEHFPYQKGDDELDQKAAAAISTLTTELQKHRAEIEKFVEPYARLTDDELTKIVKDELVSMSDEQLTSILAFRRLLKGEP